MLNVKLPFILTLYRDEIYSLTSMARTLMTHSPEVARTIIMVPTCHFRHNHLGWVKLPLARTNLYGPKPVRAIEVLLYTLQSYIITVLLQHST